MGLFPQKEPFPENFSELSIKYVYCLFKGENALFSGQVSLQEASRWGTFRKRALESRIVCVLFSQRRKRTPLRLYGGPFVPKKPSNWESCVCLVFSKVKTHCLEVTSHRSRLAHGPLFATESSNWESCTCPLVFSKVQTQSFKVTCYGVATVSRIDKIIGLFRRMSSLL